MLRFIAFEGFKRICVRSRSGGTVVIYVYVAVRAIARAKRGSEKLGEMDGEEGFQ